MKYIDSSKIEIIGKNAKAEQADELIIFSRGVQGLPLFRIRLDDLDRLQIDTTMMGNLAVLPQNRERILCYSSTFSE